jgi:ketosteroid isomerase-like protein
VSTRDLETRIRRLEDLEAIRQLKARYCRLCDDGYDADRLADLFTEDALWDGGMLGKAEGREKIRRFFQRSPEVIPFSVHMVMNPLLSVEGDTASGTWYLFQACSYAPENAALWGSARYDEEYVRVGEEWKFSRLRLTSFFWTPFDQGWMRTQSVFDRGPGGTDSGVGADAGG